MIKKNNNDNSQKRHKMQVLGILCLFGFCLLAHRPAVLVASGSDDNAPVKTVQPKKKSKVYLLHSDLLKKNEKVKDAQIVIGNVVFRHDSMYMYCDSAYFFSKINSFEAFSNVRMEQGDTLFMYGDHLYYDGLSQIAQFRNNVRMENRNTTLLTDSLNYDRVYNIGYYFNGGTLMDDQNVLTSDWGEYSPSTKQSVFNYDVRLVNKDFTLTSDTLRYNTENKVANIVGPSDIFSDDSHIYSEKGFYKTQEGMAELYDRSVLTNDGKQLTGDSLFYNSNTGLATVVKNMVMTDTINKNMLMGDYGEYNEKTQYAFVTEKALAIDYSQRDSLFLHADTLLLETFYIDTDSMQREVRAFNKVRFYRQDVQGVSDSLVFSTVDSCLTMYSDPVLWNNTQQLVGEKIKIYMNDSTIDWAHIINQSLSVEYLKKDYYNQVSSKEMKSYFKDGEMYLTEIVGSVRVVYYPVDSDGTYIGMNTSETSKLDMYLKERKLDKMIMSPQSSGVLYPMTQIPEEKKRLDNFVWFDYLRPKDKNDIYIWIPKKVEDQIKKNVRGPVELPNQHLFEKK